MGKNVIIVLIFFFLTSCATYVGNFEPSKEEINHREELSNLVTNGMSKQEVTGKIGKPISKYPGNNDTEVWTYYKYLSDNSKIIVFKNGVVIYYIVTFLN